MKTTPRCRISWTSRFSISGKNSGPTSSPPTAGRATASTHEYPEIHPLADSGVARRAAARPVRRFRRDGLSVGKCERAAACRSGTGTPPRLSHQRAQPRRRRTTRRAPPAAGRRRRARWPATRWSAKAARVPIIRSDEPLRCEGARTVLLSGLDPPGHASRQILHRSRRNPAAGSAGSHEKDNPHPGRLSRILSIHPARRMPARRQIHGGTGPGNA